MKNVIYQIRNVVTGHYYVGSTVDSRKRFWAHRKDLRNGMHNCVHLQRAWNKYGEDCFKFEIVQQLETREELFPAEQVWLDAHFGRTYCYNTSAHADAPMRDASPEMRAHLAAKTKAWLERNGHPRQGVAHDADTLQRMSTERKGKAAGPDHYRYGKTVSPEVRAKIGDTQRGKPKGPGRRVSPEGMAKIMAAAAKGHFSHWQGRTHTAESRAKMSKKVCATAPDGAETTYGSLTETLEALGLLMPTLNRALKSGKALAKGPRQGWSFKYVDPA